MLTHKNRDQIPRTKGRKLTDNTQQLRRNLLKLDLCVHGNFGCEQMRIDTFGDYFFELRLERFELFFKQGQARSILMAPELFYAICTALKCIVHIKTLYRTGRSGQFIAAFSKNQCWPVIGCLLYTSPSPR